MNLYQRAPFSADLANLRDELRQLLPDLEKNPNWYGSIYLERKTHRSISVNLKQTQVSDSFSAGVVFRVYDGYTLHEQATDQFDRGHLKRLVADFTARIASKPIQKEIPCRPYRVPTWSDRLKGLSEREILDQIPQKVRPETPVHFGIRYQKDPWKFSVEESAAILKADLERIRSSAHSHGLLADELSYAVARHSFTFEESLFIDRETLLSQTLPRLSVTLVCMSGANRAIHRVGGLGGVEIVEVKDSEIEEMIRELKSLKVAERLVPGRYRVLFGPEVSGVIAHEAFGHAQEGDTCSRGRSKAWSLYQSKTPVGNAHATILNNPAVFKNADRDHAAWGTYYFDEEGWLAASQILLHEGILQAPMTHFTSALRLGVPRTANGKRESWASGVYTRQTNTYFSAGNATLAELFQRLGDGFVATQSAGGMEDPKGMGIQVGLAWLREVKDGKFTGRIFRGPAGGDIQLTGYVPDVLHSILAKSKIDATSLELDRSQFPLNDAGGCGKYHKEYVNAGCGGPWMLFESVMLG